ncbi:MAG TPA: hypothetical protein VFD03_00800 [Clostridia bacterium]|nr:hypothetical protein [Clostridia bacterium]
MVVSNVNKCARQINGLPDARMYGAEVKLPEGVTVDHPDANIHPEYGEYMTFDIDFIMPPGILTHYSRDITNIRFKDLAFEPFISSEIKTILAP